MPSVVLRLLCCSLCSPSGREKKIIKTFLKVLWQSLNQELKLGLTARYLSQGVLRFHVKAKVNEEGVPGDPALDAREPLAPSPAVQAVPDPLAAVRQGAAGIAGTLPSCRLQQRNESSRTNWNLNSKIWPSEERANCFSFSHELAMKLPGPDSQIFTAGNVQSKKTTA